MNPGAPLAGRYRLLDVVGTGGMGRVWRARDEMLRRDVAIKEIVPLPGLSDLDRFDRHEQTLREARTAARLRHPNVVAVLDVVHTDRPWIVMEYLPSRSLAEIVAADGPLSPRATARIGRQILAGLRCAHAAGVIHRDVKPQNVLVGADGRVALTDFGIAVFDDGGGVTRPDFVIGSPSYMAPERVRDGVSTVAADLWSLGATLYAVVEGRAPYHRPTLMATLSALSATRPDRPRRAGPLAPVLRSLLERDPARRPDAATVDRQLTRIAERPTGRARATASRARATAGRTWATAGAARFAARRAEAGRGRVAFAAGWADSGRGRVAFAAGRARVAVVAAVAVLAVAAAGLTASAPVRTPAVAAPSLAITAPSPATPPCVDSRPATPTTVAPTGPYPLPAGWLWHRDPAGFTVAVPSGWVRFVDGPAVCFADPGRERVLAVEPRVGLTVADPRRHWRDEEARLLAAGALPGYTRIGLDPRLLGRGAAEWEYAWDPPGRERRHSRRIVVAESDRQGFAVSWTAPDREWGPNQPRFLVAVGSFRRTPA